MRRMKVNLFEEDALVEELAREFYKLRGCIYKGKRMQDSTHPEEQPLFG